MKKFLIHLLFLLTSLLHCRHTLDVSLTQLNQQLPQVNIAFSNPSSQKPSEFCYATISDWQKALAHLPENPNWNLNNIKKSLKNYENTVLSTEEWIHALKKCAQVLTEEYKTASWVDHKKLSNDILNLISFGKQPPLQSFVQKLSVPQNATIAFWGDLHGSVHSLVRNLQVLKKNGYLNDDFSLTQKGKKQNFFMIFLGDYVDRGKYGIEIWYTLARLKYANPDRVCIIRGNHEDASFNRQGGFVSEFPAKFTDNDQIKSAYSVIFNLYNLLPCAVFLGTQGSTEYVQCCHGGLEIGFNPQKLLTNSAQFQVIEELDQQKPLKDIQTALSFSLSENITAMDLFLEKKGEDCYKDFLRSNHTLQNWSDIGFMWNDFYIDTTTVSKCNKGRGIAFGKQIIHDFLHYFSTPNAEIKAVFRAHQHNDASGGKMLTNLQKNGGLVKLWNDKEPTVLTLCSAPDAPTLNFNYDFFLLITVKKNYKDWIFNPQSTPLKR
ncbi:MAG: metallophosphoesterase [Candidatus Babeliaceae bacterium]